MKPSVYYCHIRVVNRKTKATIAVYDSWHRDSVFDRDGGRWVTYCETHDRICNHATLALARSFLREPEQFCEKCGDKVRERDRALQNDGDNTK